MAAPRIDVHAAHEDVKSGEALLVCAYESRKKCQEHQLEDSIPLEQLQEMEHALAKERELIFYCG